MTELLTAHEKKTIRLLGEAANALSGVIGDGPLRHNDMAEAVFHIHSLQHIVMSQAAAQSLSRRVQATWRLEMARHEGPHKADQAWEYRDHRPIEPQVWETEKESPKRIYCPKGEVLYTETGKAFGYARTR